MIFVCVSFILVSAAISAYNAGAKNIRTYDGLDTGTTHNDYANDVVARATFFKRNGYWDIWVMLDFNHFASN